MAKLTRKQKRFVDEYLTDLNATQAAIRAGYSPISARDTASKNLTKPDISGAISKAIAERSQRTGVNQDRIILELAKIAFLNTADVIDFTNATVLEGASRDDTAAIAGVKVRKAVTETAEIVEHEVKTHDKLRALELLGKHLNMFNGDNSSGSEAVNIIDDL